MPGIARGHHMQNIQCEFGQRRFQQGPMRQVRRVKRTAKHTDAPAPGCLQIQTQSRRTKNLLYSSASGVPATGTCW